nr:MAG: hypothetical protein [Wuhan Mosquito Virus 6]
MEIPIEKLSIAEGIVLTVPHQEREVLKAHLLHRTSYKEPLIGFKTSTYPDSVKKWLSCGMMNAEELLSFESLIRANRQLSDTSVSRAVAYLLWNRKAGSSRLRETLASYVCPTNAEIYAEATVKTISFPLKFRLLGNLQKLTDSYYRGKPGSNYNISLPCNELRQLLDNLESKDCVTKTDSEEVNRLIFQISGALPSLEVKALWLELVVNPFDLDTADILL